MIKQGHQPSKEIVSRVSHFQAFVPGKAWSKERQALTYHTFEDIRGAEDANHYLNGVTFHRKKFRFSLQTDKQKVRHKNENVQVEI